LSNPLHLRQIVPAELKDEFQSIEYFRAFDDHGQLLFVGYERHFSLAVDVYLD
jgi:hypothetical protein